jgi:hypothetical protein
MPEHMIKRDQPKYRSTIRVLLGAALILLLPLSAMQFTDEVVWNLADFAVAGGLLVGTGLLYEAVGRRTRNIACRAAAGVALAAALLLVWINLAVGIIGDEGNPANAMYIGVLAVGVAGALIARFQPHGMARALLATALAQALITVITLSAGFAAPASGPLEILMLNGCFVALFVGSAWLFRHAARDRISPRAPVA